MRSMAAGTPSARAAVTVVGSSGPASKGIGAAIARGLAAAGAAVAVNYSFGKDGADRTVAEITSKGGKAIAIQGNVGKAADVRRLFEETAAHLGENIYLGGKQVSRAN